MNAKKTNEIKVIIEEHGTPVAELLEQAVEQFVKLKEVLFWAGMELTLEETMELEDAIKENKVLARIQKAVDRLTR